MATTNKKYPRVKPSHAAALLEKWVWVVVYIFFLNFFILFYYTILFYFIGIC
jgi:hypothetical protein